MTRKDNIALHGHIDIISDCYGKVFAYFAFRIYGNHNMIIIGRSANDRYILLNVDIRSDPNIGIVGVRITAIQRIPEISKYNRVFISFHTIVDLLDRFFESGKRIF